MSGAVFDARVTATFGRHLLVRDLNGTEHRARPLGRALGLVCGDRVRCRQDPRHAEIHVLELLPRSRTLFRTNARGAGEAVVANVSRLLIVLAPLPVPDLFVVDRYLAAAASVQLPAALILNKADLPAAPALCTELEYYAGLGYPTLSCSVRDGAGIGAVAALCSGETAVLVGQSGVGKSSLLQCLLPEAAVQIGELVRNEEGRHTTTTARLFTLPSGGELIDSPGVRDFAPAVEALEPRSLGFPEIAELAAGCRFADCRHMREPDCAVRARVDSGELLPRRYESYRRLRRLRESLEEARGPERRR